MKNPAFDEQMEIQPNEKSPVVGEEKFSKKDYIVVFAILMTELCERLTFYSLIGNLVLYCENDLNIGSTAGSTISLVFTGFVYFIPLFGGYLADVVLGRFNTIFGSGMLYLVGMVSVVLSAANYGNNHGLGEGGKRAFFFIGLAFVALGTGGIKSNVSPFGAQQVEKFGPDVVRSFFNWFYWFINLGSAIAFLGVVSIQQNISFFIGYLVPTFTLVLAILIFVSPKKIYQHEETGENALKTFCQVYICAIRNRIQTKQSRTHFLDHARISCGGDYPDNEVQNAIQVTKIIPIFSCLILFWTVYFQMSSTFFVQGIYLNLNITSFTDKANYTIPVATLNLFNTISILLITPVVDKVIFPLLKKFFNYVPTYLQRIGLGMLFIAVAIVIAGVLEYIRRTNVWKGDVWVQKVGTKYYNSSTITVFSQVPQFLMIGIGEIFTSVTSLDFAFAEAPQNMRSVIMGLCLITSGFGSWFGSALVAIVNVASAGSTQWIQDDYNYGRIDYFYYLLGGMMLADLVVFIFIARKYKYRAETDQDNPGQNMNYNEYIDLDK